MEEHEGASLTVSLTKAGATLMWNPTRWKPSKQDGHGTSMRENPQPANIGANAQRHKQPTEFARADTANGPCTRNDHTTSEQTKIDKTPRSDPESDNLVENENCRWRTPFGGSVVEILSRAYKNPTTRRLAIRLSVDVVGLSVALAAPQYCRYPSVGPSQTSKSTPSKADRARLSETTPLMYRTSWTPFVGVNIRVKKRLPGGPRPRATRVHPWMENASVNPLPRWDHKVAPRRSSTRTSADSQAQCSDRMADTVDRGWSSYAMRY
ncbi:hypothetical protein R1flu_021790 [Riccia fluitans]|uniref:Uncharacterized protein n=1 Tax=Riccia fluitans TaxID=41844 RepID=A0ABD1ZRJ1_9MARC